MKERFNNIRTHRARAPATWSDEIEALTGHVSCARMSWAIDAQRQDGCLPAESVCQPDNQNTS